MCALWWLHAAIVHGQSEAGCKWMVPRTFVSTMLHMCVVSSCLRVCPSQKVPTVMRPGLTLDFYHIHPVILVSDFHNSVILNLFHQST